MLHGSHYLHEGRQGYAEFESRQYQHPPDPAASVRSDPSLTVLQLLIDDYDEVPLGFAAGGSCVDELFISDLDIRRRGWFMGRRRALLIKQRRLFLPRPHGGTRDHVHSHGEGKAVGVPVLAVLPDVTPESQKKTVLKAEAAASQQTFDTFRGSYLCVCEASKQA